MLAAGCGGPEPSGTTDPVERHTSAEAAARDASTNLATTPLGQADVQLYLNMMGGASALGRSISAADRAVLEFAKKVDAGELTAAPSDAERLARARSLQNRDEELARLQGIDARYRDVRDRIEALVGPRAKPPLPDDPVTRENVRFLDAHRATIERLQREVRDPLSRAAADTGGR